MSHWIIPYKLGIILHKNNIETMLITRENWRWTPYIGKNKLQGSTTNWISNMQWQPRRLAKLASRTKRLKITKWKRHFILAKHLTGSFLMRMTETMMPAIYGDAFLEWVMTKGWKDRAHRCSVRKVKFSWWPDPWQKKKRGETQKTQNYFYKIDGQKAEI